MENIYAEGNYYIEYFYMKNRILLTFEQLYDHLFEFVKDSKIIITESVLSSITNDIYNSILLCWWCNGPANFTCSSCNKEVYCSKECQRAAWNLSHKYDCCSETWYIKIEEKVYGPFPNNFMKTLNINSNTLVSHNTHSFKPLYTYIDHYNGKHFEN